MMSPYGCFNPHQPVKAGASSVPERTASPCAVSILTSPLRLVLPWDAVRYETVIESFNPHQPVKAGASRGGCPGRDYVCPVSILTSPLRLVLPDDDTQQSIDQAFQSSPAR